MGAMVLFPLLVGGVLLASGLGKIGSSGRLVEAGMRFGVPPRWATLGTARLLIAGEIVLAVAVLVAPWPLSVGACAAAVAVLAGFTVLTARAHRRGDDFDCGCFGVLAETRVGRGLVVRNSALLAAAVVALVAAVGSRRSVPQTLAAFGAEEWAWLAAVTVVSAVVAVISRLLERDRARLPEPAEVASTEVERLLGYRVAPTFEVVRRDGTVVDMHALVATTPHLLVFVRPGCGSCDQLMEASDELQASLGHAAHLVFATGAAREVLDVAHPRLGDRVVFGVASAREKLGVEKTPAAVLIGLNGRLVAGPVHGARAVVELVESSAGLRSSW
ncbi:Methylamine utilisation protein MauE [Rathayibacter oskolensis]|uniref:Methylamine utilisation protein MauE n=1 Tax=Rathayibacter oskolensis TaxID=1891671 RepID=A0A1X7MYD1_9MICO|nr:MauE/DoxX family redox-associated membrane protein [Rathayibacter oskolensis]SMH29896.1 Methylamine utilisation protein MauE [Rathayibacter oskolensis]